MIIQFPKEDENPFLDNGAPAPPETETVTAEETDAQALARINLRFNAYERHAHRIVAGKQRSLIVSGPPGLGKSYTLEAALKTSPRKRLDCEIYETEEFAETDTFNAANWYDRITGSCSAPGLYHALWNMREGGLVIVDDCDKVFDTDLDAVNLIKLATDSSKERWLSWRKKSSWLDDNRIARTFEFKGSLVLATNIDFEIEIQRHNKHTEHFRALIDRSDYLCLTLRTQRDFLLRIRSVSAGPTGMLQRFAGLTAAQVETVLTFIEQNAHRFYNLSLRLANDVADKVLNSPESWQQDIEATKMKTK